jgi:LysM repeat protein
MLKVVAWLALAAAGVLFPLAVLAAYDVTGSSSPAPFRIGSSEGSIPATVEINPDTLNLKSHGQWVTTYIELPQGYDVDDIDSSTVRLCLGPVSACPEDASIPAEAHPSAIGDHDHDGIPDRVVKFDRGEFIELLGGQTGDVTMTVAGVVSPPGEPFAGSDTIRVTHRGCRDGARDALCEDEEADEDLPEATPTPEATPEATAPPEGTSAPLETASSPSPTPEAAAVEPPAVVGQALPVAASTPPDPAPGPAPPTSSPPDIPTVEYSVRPGERLADVATFFGTTVDAIVALNGLTDPNLVVAGQRLVVPAPPANTAPGQVFMSEYVVQPGETLTDIAARFGTTVEALAAENGLANPSAIRIGDRLLVP